MMNERMDCPMKQIILMRHATAQPEQYGLVDRDRILISEGMQELELVRKKLQGKLEGLNLVLCSNVKRTRQTYEGIKTILPSSCESGFEDALYNASANYLLERLRDLDSKKDFVLIIAHNPGVSDFLGMVMASTNKPEGVPRIFPPAGVAILEGNFTKWGQLTPARLTIKQFLKPENHEK
jgi:phosphohistidine phosphatase